MVRVTATGSAVTRTPFPGVAGLYRALETGTGGPRRPFFYVSSSPWNLYGFLTGFLRHRDIPLGPLLLRDLGIDETKFVKSSHGDHKLVRIREVLELHPTMPVVLVGDSGQHDPQIYAQVVAEHPGRVRAVWIREVRLDPGDEKVERLGPRFDEAGVPMVLAPDSTAFAEHAVELGLVPPEVAAAVARAVTDEEAGASATTAGPERH
nr:App1 family protein [Salsipaludibacter albus]